MHPNLIAALDAIAWSEGTSRSPVTKDSGYDVIVDSIDANGKVVHAIFTDYSKHPFVGRPPVLVSAKRHLLSDAAGRHMCMLRNWLFYSHALRLPDFGHDSQNAITIQMIKEVHALDDILTGHLDAAFRKMASRWASLPGAGYGQPENKMNDILVAYEDAGGKLA